MFTSGLRSETSLLMTVYVTDKSPRQRRALATIYEETGVALEMDKKGVEDGMGLRRESQGNRRMRKTVDRNEIECG